MSENHLVSFNDEGWSLWKWFELRSGGFAADGAKSLGSDDVHDALSRLYTAVEELSAARAAAEVRLDELAADSDVEKSRVAKRMRKRVRFGKSLSSIDDAPFDELRNAIDTAADALEKQEQATLEALEIERIRASEALRAYAAMPRFREAIVWQNRAVIATALDGYLRSEVGVSNKRGRERQRLLAKYIQRYTLKNDTIGFFGPTAWGSIDRACDSFDLSPGPVVARREAFFEYWMAAALVEQLNQLPEMFPICSLRLRLGSWITNTEHVSRDGTAIQLTALEASILDLASASGTVADIAVQIVGKGQAQSADEVYEQIRGLVRRQLATAKIELPTEVIAPEQWLRSLLENLPACEAREKTLSTLDTLRGSLDNVADAAGDPERLDEAIEKLEGDFRDATDLAAKRAHGQVYAGRQIFYEECVRGGDVTIGRQFLDSLQGPLALVLTSARWFTYHIGRKYRAAFLALHKELVSKAGGQEIPLMSFQVAAVRYFKDDPRQPSEIIGQVQAELRRRWEQVLCLEQETSSRVSIRSEECEARVAELFKAPGPGWPMARYQSPDVMLAAPSATEVAAGNFQAVLGELHCGINTLLAMAPFYLHPHKEELALANSSDLVEPSISPVLFSANRVAMVSVAPNTLDLENKGARSWRSRDQVLESGDLFVEETDGQLEVVSRTSAQRFDIMRVMDNLLSNAAMSHFSLLARKPHMPRVTIDNLVISRERWTFKRAEFADLVSGKRTPVEDFIAVSHWVRERGLPRFMFAVVPNELKPLYVDFASTSLVDVLLHFLGKAATLTLSEMLPGHGEHWLQCDEGNHYASELRIVALDPVPWAPGM